VRTKSRAVVAAMVRGKKRCSASVCAIAISVVILAFRVVVILVAHRLAASL